MHRGNSRFPERRGAEGLATRTNMTKEQKTQAIELLFAEKCSCVIRNGDSMRIFRERGVADLFRLQHEGAATAAGRFPSRTKVVGKGAAALMVLGGVEGLFADVVSRPALELLAGAGIAVEYTVVVPNIVNRAGTGTCPWSSFAAGRRRPPSACR